MIKKLKLILVAVATVFTVGAAPAYAQGSLFGGNNSSSSTKCGDTQTEFIACDSKTGTGTIGDLIRVALLIMTIGIGIVAVGGIGYASIIYASARDDQSKVSEARTIIRNIVIGLILYGMTLAIMAWLLPGSVIEAPEPSTSPSPSSSVPPTQSTAPTP